MISRLAGRRAVIVSEQGEARVLYPLLRDRLGVIPEALIVDVERRDSVLSEPTPADAVRKKIAAAAETTAYDALFIASDATTIGLYDPQHELDIVVEAPPQATIADALLDLTARIERELAPLEATR